ncbi:hypothetical protein KAR91_47535 [Candidatus Pacearchaeota archaeon]|nr:hypothetical protein [Candidatus Pacearchaeota archaeon]
MSKLEQLTLGELIKYLEGLDPEQIARYGIGEPHSYRGFYEDLAFELKKDVTHGKMLADAKGALGFTYTGYKGGDFTMSEHTDVWLAEYGSTGTSISIFILEMMLDVNRRTT